MIRSRTTAAAALFVAGFLTPVLAQDAAPYVPKIAPASNEGERALQGFKLPEGMVGSLFAAEPMLANPVAFAIDEKGRVYVAETFRQQHGVEDNRYP